MVIVKGLDKVYSLDVRGKLFYPCGFGRVVFGYNKFGFYSVLSGIYSQKITKKGRAISRMKFYRPTNPQTETQQAWRDVFSAGVLAWRSLSSEDKEQLNRRALKFKMEGFNFFMRNWLYSHK